MNSFFFWISKIAWNAFSPDSLVLLLSVFSLIFLWMKAYKKAKKLMTILVFFIITITVFPVGDWLSYPLEKRFPSPIDLPESVDGIIVLGGAENIYTSYLWHQVELNGSAERFFAFIELAKKYPHARHVYTGGTGSMLFQAHKGALVAKKLFQEQGLDISRIIFESQSRNTYENAVFTRKLIDPKPGEKWILITSAAHMPRSFGIFSKLGWQVIPYCVDHESLPNNLFIMTWDFSVNLSRLNSALKEWTGLTAYYLTGKTTRFFPRPSDL